MPSKPDTVKKRVEELPEIHRKLLLEYWTYLLELADAEERTVINCVKPLCYFSKHLVKKDFRKVTREDIVSFLDTRKKSEQEDQDQRWMRTWNDYYARLVQFYRWLYNKDTELHREDWKTPNNVFEYQEKEDQASFTIHS